MNEVNKMESLQRTTNKSHESVDRLQLDDELLRRALIRYYEKSDKVVEEILKDVPPHKFSEEFERKMEELMRVATPEERNTRLRAKKTGK